MRFARIASVLALIIAASEGKTLYDTKCAQCHGKDGIAKPPGNGSKNFNDPAFQSAWSAESIATITAEGKGKMPGYRSKLSSEQIKAVAAHVKTLGPAK
jgi:mono/diheme cytochrome c family protein